jgi:hypothetical protein
LSVTCDRSVVFSGYSGFVRQENLPARYNWNIVESGIECHKPNHCHLFTFSLMTIVKSEADGNLVHYSVIDTKILSSNWHKNHGDVNGTKTLTWNWHKHIMWWTVQSQLLCVICLILDSLYKFFILFADKM